MGGIEVEDAKSSWKKKKERTKAGAYFSEITKMKFICIIYDKRVCLLCVGIVFDILAYERMNMILQKKRIEICICDILSYDDDTQTIGPLCMFAITSSVCIYDIVLPFLLAVENRLYVLCGVVFM